MPQLITNSGRTGRRLPVLLFLTIFTIIAPVAAQESKENADYKLAVNLFNDRMYDLAAQQSKQCGSAYPNTAQSIEARFYLGLVQMQLMQFDEAKTTFQNFALSYVEHPRAPEAWLNVGHAFHALGNDKEAAPMASFVGPVTPPIMLVVRRPGKIVTQIPGRVESTVVAQAAHNAGARRR